MDILTKNNDILKQNLVFLRKFQGLEVKKIDPQAKIKQFP